MKIKAKDDYSKLKTKIFLYLTGMAAIALVTIYVLYAFVWVGHGSYFMIEVFQRLLKIDYEKAWNIYDRIFRNNADLIIIVGIAAIFLGLLFLFLNWFTRYFTAINSGIESLLKEKSEEIILPEEMSATERKLNTVKQTLKNRALAAQLAEQRKNDLVMYLAHDIRTPLTSVIGYLSLLEEAPDMPDEQKAKYVHITLDKANRLEKMVNEFFDITRYNLQQIVLSKESIDLYYMLVQLTDELSPTLTAKGNTTVLQADENLSIYGDPDQLARVFNNVLKNAAAYSFPNTEIIISALEKNGFMEISFSNTGKTIPEAKLSAIFEKFYRLDESRTSDTGGSGLGLAIAKEIVNLHGGTITAKSKDEKIEFLIKLPVPNAN